VPDAPRAARASTISRQKLQLFPSLRPRAWEWYFLFIFFSKHTSATLSIICINDKGKEKMAK
jgi:hypothetical protein